MIDCALRAWVTLGAMLAMGATAVLAAPSPPSSATTSSSVAAPSPPARPARAPAPTPPAPTPSGNPGGQRNEAAPPPAVSQDAPARSRMHECGHQWSAMKKAGTVGTLTWKEFSATCLVVSR